MTPISAVEAPQNRRAYLFAVVANVVITVLMIVALDRGRIWFCACGEFRLWISDVNGAHNSQHLLDPYSLTHLLHGVLFAAC